MLRITKGTSNILTVTVTEKQTLTTPYYLFRFVNVQTQNEYFCYLADTSIYTERYNTFTLIEGTSVTLVETGQYNYFIYQKATNTNNTYVVANELERGICDVNGTAATINSYTPTSGTNYVYNG